MIIFNSTGLIVGRSELAMVEPIAEEVNSQTTAAPDFSPDGSKPGFGTLQQESPPKLLQGSNPVSCEPFPAQIGRYRIEKLLGSGSFGRVLLGYDGSLDRQVAIREVIRANARYTWAVIGWVSVKVASGQIRPDEVISMVCAPLISLILMF
jgi:serine/threonine protein kinase